MTSRVMKRAAARLPVRITRIFGRKDERARIGGIDFGHKGKVEKPAEKAGAKVSPNTAAAAAHSLRSALGLRTDPDATDQIAKAMRERRRAPDVPDAVAPSHTHRPPPGATEFGPTGARVPQDPAKVADALVFMWITTAYNARGRQRSITLDAAEIAGTLV